MSNPLQKDDFKRYEVFTEQHTYMIKDHQEEEWIARCFQKFNADKIAFLLNEFERLKGPIQPKLLENEPTNNL